MRKSTEIAVDNQETLHFLLNSDLKTSLRVYLGKKSTVGRWSSVLNVVGIRSCPLVPCMCNDLEVVFFCALFAGQKR